MAREIIHAGLHNQPFVERATEGFAEYAASVEPFTLAEGERLTGVPAEVIRDTAHAYARADRAMICWTLGITEHHNAVDNVLALINLGLLCGHVGRWGSGLNPLRGQNNVQGGGDMGAIPNKLPGFQDLERDHEARARFEQAWGTPIRPQHGWHLTQMFHAMERGELRTLYVIGENPAQSEADVNRARKLLGALDLLVVQDIVMTRTAEMADVVLPGTASWCEAEGTVTNSERRVQRVRKALDPPGDARDDTWILAELAQRLGHDWGHPTAEEIWDECRSLSPMHRGMRYDRLEALRGIQWPCPDEEHPGSPFLHGRLWADPPEGPLAPLSVVEAKPPFEELDADYPIRLTTGRRLESFNTGAQSSRYRSPLAPRRVPRPLARGRRAARGVRGRGRPCLVAEGIRRGAGAGRSVAPRGARVHDVPLPRRRGRQPADDRRDRPEVRHRRVQGRGDSGREVGARFASTRFARTGDGSGLMDLKLVPNAEPTPSERAALDDVLGPPGSSWEGGARETGVEGNTAAGGHAARERRHLLLPALWALQERIGWISPGGLNEICRRLTVPPADAYGVATFYALFALEPRPPRVVHVCEDVACRCHGAQELIAQVEERFGPEGELSDDGSATWYRSPCLGQCDRAPAALVAIAGEEPLDRAQAPTTAEAVLRLLAGGEPGPPPTAPLPQYGDPSLRLLRRVGIVDPASLDDYRAHGGYARAPPGGRARPGGRPQGGEGLEPSRPWRRGVPHGREMGGGRAPARQAALPRLQRRRVGARDVQGPRADGGRPLRARRGDDHRRVCHRVRGRLRLRARRVPRGAARARARALRGATAWLPRRRRDGRGLRLRRRDPPRRGRLHLRGGDRALRVDRGQARRAAQQAAVPGRGRALRQADGRQQRRDAGQRPRRRARLRPSFAEIGTEGSTGHQASLPLGSRRATGDVRGSASARRSARFSSWPAACRAGRRCRRS